MIKDKVYNNIDYLEDSSTTRYNICDNLYSYVGSGCIFNYDEKHLYGDEKTGFTEEDTPNFFRSNYAIAKGYTDRLMHLFDDSALNIRLRMCMNSENNQRNFLTKFLTYEKILSNTNSISILPELIPILIDMIKNNITGTFNLTNPGIISHNEILEMYKNIIDPTFTWKNMTLEEQSKILSGKRPNNCLDTSKLEKLYPNVKNIKYAVKECLKNYK